MDDLLGAGYRRMRAVAAAGQRPLAVHVGADTLGSEALWTDLHLYTRVLTRAGLPPGSLHLAFVEPIASKAAEFWRYATTLPARTDQVSLVNAVLDGSCPAAHRTFYALSQRAGRDFGFDMSMANGWASSRRAHPLDVVRLRSSMNMPMRCTTLGGDCSEHLRRLANSPNAEAYIDELQIPCRTLGGLVHQAGAKVSDLAMVVVDAEGMDARILLGLAGHQDFKPGFIMWEEGGEPGTLEKTTELAILLRSRGYAVGIKTGPEASAGAATGKRKLEGDSTNVIAVLKQPERKGA